MATPDRSASDPPFERIGGDDPRGPLLFTCEHAGRGLPEWRPDDGDRPFLEDHWGWDVGAADLTRALARRTSCPAVLSTFSRLVCDPNRDPDEPSFVVREVDGHALSFNADVDDAERERRRERYAEPYHEAIDRLIERHRAVEPGVRLCSVHSFTPVYLGRPRPMEVGVLFDDYDETALTLEQALAAEGFETALNAPYSGKDGLIHAARRHGRAHGIVYLELEVRQDLIDTPARAEAIAERIARALAAYSA